ncbi:MAG: hypothetical protein M3Q30_19815 [Actinomycetota bacterium]|nr:hypothetical protein [Actinomycetota bacterium]
MLTPLRMGGLFAAGAIVLAACGGGGGKPAAANDMAGMAMPPAAAGAIANASAAVATEAVHIKNLAFSPATITVQARSTVVWTNDDAIRHNEAAGRLDCPCHRASSSLQGDVLRQQFSQPLAPLPHIQVRQNNGQIEINDARPV